MLVSVLTQPRIPVGETECCRVGEGQEEIEEEVCSVGLGCTLGPHGIPWLR